VELLLDAIGLRRVRAVSMPRLIIFLIIAILIVLIIAILVLLLDIEIVSLGFTTVVH